MHSLRRSGLVLALATAAALLAPIPASAAMDTAVDAAKIEVRRDGEVFVVEATLRAPVSPAIAWDVLTDFERMETFVPNVRDSRIVARDGNRLTIRQTGVARFGPLTFAFQSERAVDLEPPTTIRSRQLKGNMRRLESVTTFAADGAGTRIEYRAQIEPGALFPGIVTREFLRHEIAEQFDAIVEEMVRRRGPG